MTERTHVFRWFLPNNRVVRRRVPMRDATKKVTLARKLEDVEEGKPGLSLRAPTDRDHPFRLIATTRTD
jgi:hypothetical protein